MTDKIRVGIIGSAGYTGGELIRILINHSFVNLVFLHSVSNANKKVFEVHKDLLGSTEMTFTNEINDDVDVIFLCLGHGDSLRFLSDNKIEDKIKIIDLSQDFRINNLFENRNFVYGLTELNKNLIASANNIANPGCFATAIQLALLPIIKEQIKTDFSCVGITGATGAGQLLQYTTSYNWRLNNISAYKSLTHQHINEIRKNFKSISKNFNDDSLNFVPWRGNFTRGIFVSSIFKSELSLTQTNQLYKNFFSKSPFTFLANENIDLKQVINTNKCHLYIEKENNSFVVHSAIDNLIKGASGQAVQNMNIMFNIDETEGLKLKGSVY